MNSRWSKPALCSVALLVFVGPALAQAPERIAFFGDIHLHTSYSTDAFLLMTRTTPDDSYRFAQGQEVEYLGHRVKRKAPLDFLAVTDHAEYLGVVRMALKPDGPLKGTRWGDWLAGDTVEGSAAAYKELLKASGESAKIDEFENPALQKSAWDEYVAYADKYYAPGRFTTFVAFEWTSAPGNQNLHRNVIFRGKGPDVPFSSKESNDPEQLWAYMERQRKAGLTLLAIPHNGNASNGLMFNTEKTLSGAPITRDYLERRRANEPLTEVAQVKGQSETHPLLSPNDEFASFELYEYLIGVPRKANFATGSYIRQAYGAGQALQEKFGINPFKLGLVGGTDFHSGVSATEESAYPGSHGNQDPKTLATITATTSIGGEPPVGASAAALTGVWAEANTREAIFDALQRKETFGTSGGRIQVRFFGGWNFGSDTLSRPDWVRRAYTEGVPMGDDLKAGPAGLAPTFIVQALKDPDSGNLDRVQIIKVETRGGVSKEQVFDVAWSGDRKPDLTGKLPSVGNTVDLAKASYENSIGAVELMGTWQDPTFDPSASATYYARAIEIPTPRWSTRWAVELGSPLNPEAPPMLQERAWTSPIWYTPPGIAR
ncbi:DUF3604 domain-containing protein [Tardiphaga sp. vice352]|uniref:DUF3604 domain-containing protein n=1 Tax=unclassified Tardiphaga TaxID=2631404 RepID=UPI00116351B5|nr:MULTISPECIES: DUF3604 domain-containing protein [unclassified Tardiphaga]QDM18210.1 DUF3604 domain-containing protein [Tardiphaga sp. vice278]QDM23216.1 DUF3604 domain-containing protein [Tardiphaga sp. vice154]QDM33534.1 DUF3604 domain-containing protein [Tardiphaga sp. vice352]